MLGASEESSAVFSSCSESGANEAVKAQDKKKEKAAAKVEANKKAVKLAAKNKKIGETITKMKAITSCAQLGTAEGQKGCYSAVKAMRT